MIGILKREDLSNTKEYQEVLSRIKKERKKRMINDDDLKSVGNDWEVSCFSQGEAYTLVEVDLIYGHQSFHPTWKAIRENYFLLELAYNYLVFGSREGLRL